MIKYFQRRLLQAIPTFFGVTILSFMIILSAPGDPVAMITWGPNINTEAGDAMRRHLGLDQPPLVQYVYWLVGNDWTLIDMTATALAIRPAKDSVCCAATSASRSRTSARSCRLLMQRIPATLRLGVAAITIGFLMGVVLGVLAAVFHGTWVDQVIRIISVVGNAVPQFWLGLLLIIIFGVQLDLLPISGMQNITRRGGFDLADALRHMILPVFVLSLNWIAFLSRFTRTQILEVLQQDYVRTAYAKGLNEK